MDRAAPMTDSLSLEQLEAQDEFIHRHIGPTPTEQAQMLASLNVSSLDELN